MCLSIPARLIEVDGAAGKVDADGNVIQVDLSLVEEAKAGDYVLVHAGFAIERYDEAEALATLALLREAFHGDSQEV